MRVTASPLLPAVESSHHSAVSLHQSLLPGCVSECHGCRHRHLAAAASLAQKASYLQRVLAPWADRLEPIRAVSGVARRGYRDRVTLTARWDAACGWRFGLMRRDELIAIHDCPIHTPRVNALVDVLRRSLPDGTMLPLAYLHVAGGQATLIVKAHHVERAQLQPLLARVGDCGIEGLWLHLHPAAGRRLFARSGWTLLWGNGQSASEGGLVHGATSFQQLLPALHRDSLQRAAAHFALGSEDAVLDLYCGVGASLRQWTAAGASALGIELSGDAITCAARNAPQAAVLRGTCVQRLPQVRAWWQRQTGQRHVYANPPRSGLEAELRDAVALHLQPQRYAYLSCSAGTLARDLAAFEHAGYGVSALVPYDFFPGTHHVEVLALGERGERAD
jgi:tRNA/tmRNA/rRNA uracil-C5-methylase (TrmA/RlmC/RlmD family)